MMTIQTNYFIFGLKREAAGLLTTITDFEQDKINDAEL
jgi:hypothetical protein